MSREAYKALEQRFRDIAVEVGPHVWRWGGGDSKPFKRNEKLRTSITSHDDGTFSMEFRRASDEKACAHIRFVVPVGIKNLKRSPPVTGESKTIDAAKISILAYDEPFEQEAGYRVLFEQATTESDAVSAGLSVAIRNCFTAGNDGTPVKNETEITAEAHSEWSKQNRQDGAGRARGHDPLQGAGRIRRRLLRQVGLDGLVRGANRRRRLRVRGGRDRQALGR